MDQELRETLAERAEAIDVPPDAWERLRSRVTQPGAPPGKQSLWRRLRPGRVLEVAAVGAMVAGLLFVAAVRNEPPANYSGSYAGLTLEEHPLEVDPENPKFPMLAPEEVRAQRKDWRETSPEARAKAASEILAPSGHRIVPKAYGGSTLFDLYRGDEVVLAGIYHFTNITANSKGDRFLFRAFTNDDRYLMVDETGARELEPADIMRHGWTVPEYVGDDLVAVEATHPVYTVTRGGKPVWTWTDTKQRANHPVRQLTAWGDRWVVEVDNMIIVDGQNLNEQHGYEESFGWRLVGDKPLYFFKQGGKVRISYNGQVLPAAYDEVLHHLCCEPARYNMGGSDTVVSFYARKGRAWRFVDLGVFDKQ